MSGSANKSRRDQVQEEESFLRSLLNEWDPITGSPSDEYDTLVHRLISELHAGMRQDSLNNLIAEYFANHVGVPMPPHETGRVAKRIWKWWQDRSKKYSRVRDV